MKRLKPVILTLLGAAVFAPVRIGTGTYLGMSAICMIHQCSRDMAHGDPVPSRFQVLVSAGPESSEVQPVLLSDLAKHLSAHPTASLRLNASAGLSFDRDWEFSSVAVNANEQVISLKFQDDLAISETYRVLNGAIRPLTYSEKNVGQFFCALLFGAFFSWFIRTCARRFGTA